MLDDAIDKALEYVIPERWGDVEELDQQHAFVLATAVRAQRARTCDTCRYQWPATNPDGCAVCGKVSIPGHSVAIVRCQQLGNGCRAWQIKVPA